MAKFQRNYILKVEDRDGLIRTIEMPFTVEFDVTRNPLCSNVVGSLRIYNLKADTRDSIAKTNRNPNIYRRCEFRAGYEKDLHTILVGNVLRCYSKREGVNYITTIEVYSGQYAAINHETQITVGKGKQKLPVMTELIKSLPKVGAPYLSRKYSGEFGPRDVTLSGKTVDIIKEYTNGQFYIDNEVPYLITEGEYVNGIVNEISSESGLLGSPQIEGEKISFSMIFEPRLLMFQIILLNSRTEKLFNGQFKVIQFRHHGVISESVGGSAITDVQVYTPPEVFSLIDRSLI